MAGKTASDRSSKALLKKALLKSDRFLQQLLLSSSPVQVFEVFCKRLNSWVIARLLPSQRWAIVARFHRQSDADGYAQVLRQMMPGVLLWVAFDGRRGGVVGLEGDGVTGR